MLMLLNLSRRSPINIIDVSTNYEHESIESILSGTDMFLIVINPFPAELNKNKDKIEKLLKLKKEGFPIEFIINYYTPVITKKDLSAYKYKIPLTHPQISEKLFNPLLEIIKNIIPLGVLKENIKNQSLNDKNIIYRIKEKIAGLKSVFTGVKF